MPNSLKCRLKGLVRKGLLSEKDLSRLYTDNDVVNELEDIKAEIRYNGLYNEQTECLIDNRISEWKKNW